MKNNIKTKVTLFWKKERPKMNPFGIQNKYFNFLALLFVQALLQSHSFVLKSVCWHKNGNSNSYREKVPYFTEM